jgi:uncharacterized DUF497 family protein
MIDLSLITGFDRDIGNARKNAKHGVSTAEAEQVFFNAPLLLLEDAAHSQDEPRLHALCKTDEGCVAHYVYPASIGWVNPGHISQRHAPKGASRL